MMQVLFFAISALVLFLGHGLAYLFLTKFFEISSRPGKFILFFIILLLFFSVVLSSYLIHRHDSSINRSYYIFSWFWIGILLNIGLMAALVIMFKISLAGFSISFPVVLSRIIFISGIIIISSFGLFRALKPMVTEYEVSIKDLPSSWDGKKIVHVSDVHLGPVYREKFLSSLVDKINALNPEAIFITGDFFDGMESDFSWLHNSLRKIKAPRGVFYGFGNHDLYLGYNKVLELFKEAPIEVLDNSLKEVDDLQIIGINYSFSSDFDLESEILKQVSYDQNKASVLLFHAPKNIELAKSAGIDLQLSGHTHDGQVFPFNLVVKWAHKGYGYGLFKEDDFNLIVSSGVGTWGPLMRTSSRSEIVSIVLKKK